MIPLINSFNSIILFLLPVLLFFPDSSYGQIYGRCLDAQTGNAVENARIVHAEQTITTTSRSGHFSFKSDTIKKISVLHPDYKTMTEEVFPNRENFFLLTPSDRKIDEVTVSAPLLNYQSKKVPAGFSIVLKDTLHPSMSAIDIIEQSPGVVMQKGALNTGRVMIRGIGSRSPYATTRIRAYLDDIPLTSGDGHTTIEDLEMYNIARTEVVRGPSSALYGSGMGGIIVFHPDHSQPSSLSVDALTQYGPFDQTKALISTGIRKQRSIIKATGSYTQTSGFRENNDYERWNGQIMLRHLFGSHSLFFMANYINLDAQIPSSLDHETYINSPEKAAANWKEVQGFERYDKWLSGITLKSHFSEIIKNKLSLYLNHINSYETRPFNILDDKMLTYGMRNELTWQTEYFEMIAGGEIFSEQYNWKLFEIIDGNEGGLFANNHETRRYINIFAKTDIPVFDTWNLSAGVNIHYLRFRLDDEFTDEEDVSGTYSYDPVISPRIGITGELSENMIFFASAGHGFSAPSVEETLLPEGNINPDLKPEEGINYDTGLRGKALNQRLNFDLTAYYVSLENLLVTKRETEEIFYGINAGETRHFGLESMIRAHISRETSPVKIDFTLSHTWMDNEFTDFVDEGNDYSGNQLPGIPDHYFRGALLATTSGNSHLRLEWNHSGMMYLNDANTKQYGGHHLFHLKASQIIKTGNGMTWEWQGGINNVFDQHHASMVLVNAPSFGGSAPRHYYPGAPRNAYMRLILKLTK